MTRALVTMLNDDFVIGFKAMLASLLEHNTWFDLPIVILDDGVSDAEKIKLLDRYDNIIFQPINREKYKDFNMRVTAQRLRSTYYKLDVFAIKDFSRIVFIDSDTLILANIKPLFDCNETFAAVKGYDCINDMMRRDINSGVFVVNQIHLTEQVYEELLKIAKSGHKMPDQTTLNMYFRNKIHYLEKNYNVEKRMLHTKNFRNILRNIKILHFVGDKPWQPKTCAREERYTEFEKLWSKYNVK
jgi:lipopolysaccharide biosynthesis glycosyltransferase